jgi:hypothetical protein
MPLHRDEQRLNRSRLAAILSRTGLRKKHQRRIVKLLQRYGMSQDTFDRGALRYGDSCIAAAPMPPWHGATASLPDECN